VERVPAFRKELPEMYQDSKDSMAERVFAVTTLLASYSVCQAALKVGTLASALRTGCSDWWRRRRAG
jgi:hypothetical protein